MIDPYLKSWERERALTSTGEEAHLLTFLWETTLLTGCWRLTGFLRVAETALSSAIAKREGFQLQSTDDPLVGTRLRRLLLFTAATRELVSSIVDVGGDKESSESEEEEEEELIMLLQVTHSKRNFILDIFLSLPSLKLREWNKRDG